jgi:Uncharacterised nucleotidyltransferase
LTHQHERLLLAILRERWDEAETLAPVARAEPGTFVEFCRQADITPWVHSRLSETGRLGLVGEDAARRLTEIRTKVRNDNLLLISQAERAFDLLREAGVTPVVLKGLDVLHRVYARFDERTIDDVDLLVAEAQLRPALSALEAGGWEVPPEPQRSHYIRSSHHLGLTSPGPVTVQFELHWNLAQTMRFRVDPAGLIERSRPLSIGDRPVRRLDDHDLVAHLLLHHFTHYFDRRIKWAVDLRKIASQPEFRWDAVVERLRSWDAAVVSGFAVLHLRKLFPELIPDAVAEALPAGAWRQALLRPLKSDHPMDLFRATRTRRVQLYLAAVMLERPSLLPRWLIHRTVRDSRPSANPLER